MAFTGNFMCTSFKVELMKGIHNFSVGGNTFKLALYDNNAAFTAATTAYTSSDEVTASGSYVAVVNEMSLKSVNAVVPEEVGSTLVKVPPPET